MAKRSKTKDGTVLTTTKEKNDRFETLKAEHRAMLDRRCPYLTPDQRNLAAHQAANREIFDTDIPTDMDPWAPLSPTAPTVVQEMINSSLNSIQFLMEKVNTALAKTPWDALDLAVGRDIYFQGAWETAIIVRDRFRSVGWVVNIVITDKDNYFRFEWPTDPPANPADDILFEEY